MFYTLLGLLHFLQLTTTYNLVIDTQVRGINKYLQGFQHEFERQLENSWIRNTRGKRCLGNVNLIKTSLSNVTVSSTLSAIANNDHYLKVQQLNALLHGWYRHNLLFMENEGNFQVNVYDINATLGPLVPINIEGIPYLHHEISCSIRYSTDRMKFDGAVLRWLARKQLAITIKEDLERILCNSFVEIMDEKIRNSLNNFQFVIPVNNDTSLSYRLVGQPLLLQYGGLRTFHAGVISNTHHGTKFKPSMIESEHDVVYHIHEALLSEVIQSFCSHGYMDGFHVIVNKSAYNSEI